MLQYNNKLQFVYNEIKCPVEISENFFHKLKDGCYEQINVIIKFIQLIRLNHNRLVLFQAIRTDFFSTSLNTLTSFYLFDLHTNSCFGMWHLTIIRICSNTLINLILSDLFCILSCIVLITYHSSFVDMEDISCHDTCLKYLFQQVYTLH